jgi:transposase
MLPTYSELARLLKEALAEIETLKEEHKALLKENQALKTKIKELEEKLNTNCSNSSKPPSQDPFRAPRKKKSTGRKQGAQKGHRGHRRQLVPIEQVQILHDVKPSVCSRCHSESFDAEVVATEVRQVVELPDAPPEITQYNIHTCRCSCCGKHVRADVPKEARFGFGPRLMGLVTSLSGEFHLSKRQVTALMGKFNIRICSGSVCKIHARASEILKEPYEEIKAHTLQKQHLNADETSWKTLSKKRWIWVGSSDTSVFFEIKASRSAKAFQEIFGTFKGGLTTDRYSGYNSHEGERQLCWAHAGRDFEKIAGRAGIDKWIGDQLLGCKESVFTLWHSFKEGGISRGELIEKIKAGPKEDMKILFKAGAAPECKNKTRSTCADFFNRFEMLWVFVYNENMEPTNNAAEQRLRAGVIWRKLCYGSQSTIGERFVERIMTVGMTLKLRAKNSFEYFTECFRAHIYNERAPPIFSG